MIISLTFFAKSSKKKEAMKEARRLLWWFYLNSVGLAGYDDSTDLFIKGSDDFDPDSLWSAIKQDRSAFQSGVWFRDGQKMSGFADAMWTSFDNHSNKKVNRSENCFRSDQLPYRQFLTRNKDEHRKMREEASKMKTKKSKSTMGEASLGQDSGSGASHKNNKPLTIDDVNVMFGVGEEPSGPDFGSGAFSSIKQKCKYIF